MLHQEVWWRLFFSWLQVSKSQYLCRFSDFKVRTKFLIGHHEILKRYGTHFGPIYGIAGCDTLPPPKEAGASCSTALLGWVSTGYLRVSHGSIKSHAICATPAFLIFIAAFLSRSIVSPQDGQTHTRSESVRPSFTYPQWRHSLEEGNHLFIVISFFPCSASL